MYFERGIWFLLILYCVFVKECLTGVGGWQTGFSSEIYIENLSGGRESIPLTIFGMEHIKWSSPHWIELGLPSKQFIWIRLHMLEQSHNYNFILWFSRRLSKRFSALKNLQLKPFSCKHDFSLFSLACDMWCFFIKEMEQLQWATKSPLIHRLLVRSPSKWVLLCRKKNLDRSLFLFSALFVIGIWKSKILT